MARIAKAKPVSLYPPVIERIEARRGSLPFSAQLAADLETYWRAVDLGMKSVRQKLTEADLLTIRSCMQGTYWDAGTLSVMLWGGILADVQDSEESTPGLVEKIKALTDLENLALLDWLKHDRR